MNHRSTFKNNNTFLCITEHRKFKLHVMETTIGEKENLINKKLVRGKLISATGVLSMCVCAFVVAASSVCVQGLQRAVPDFEHLPSCPKRILQR